VPQLLTEGIVDQLFAYYKQRMEAKVNALNLEYGDSLLEHPLAYFAGLKGYSAGVNYPAVFVLGDEMRIAKGRYNSTFTDASHDIEIMVAVSETNPERLQRMLYRFGRIIWELLVTRYFESSEDDYPTIGPDSDASEPRIVYERPGVDDTYQSPNTGAQIGKVHLYVTVNKQENVY
jgi:hypothetical protein